MPKSELSIAAQIFFVFQGYLLWVNSPGLSETENLMPSHLPAPHSSRNMTYWLHVFMTRFSQFYFNNTSPIRSLLSHPNAPGVVSDFIFFKFILCVYVYLKIHFILEAGSSWPLKKNEITLNKKWVLN